MPGKYIIAVFCLLISISAPGQTKQVQPKKSTVSDGFCEAMMQFIADASSGFGQIKGKETESTSSSITYSVQKGMPGTTMSSIISDSVVRYEGILYQGVSVKELKEVYGNYKRQLSECLREQKYTTLEVSGDEKKLSECPLVVYVKPGDADPNRHGTVRLTADYSAVNNIYTLTLAIAK